MSLMPLQSLLERLNDLQGLPCAEQFLVPNQDALPPAARRDSTEQLILVEEADCTYIGLYLEPALLTRLAAAPPVQTSNLADHCDALEGLSHLLYVLHTARYERAVSILELELQAEIDRFVALWHLIEEHHGGGAQGLHRQLFERVRLEPTLTGDRAELYRLAHCAGGRYCAHLARSLSRPSRLERKRTLAELRGFYRASLTQKLDHIRRCG